MASEKRSREPKQHRDGNPWQTECTTAVCHSPLGCLMACFCPCCVTFGHRKEILQPDWPDNYEPCGGLCCCCNCCCTPCAKACPNCCLACEVTISTSEPVPLCIMKKPYWQYLFVHFADSLEPALQSLFCCSMSVHVNHMLLQEKYDLEVRDLAPS